MLSGGWPLLASPELPGQHREYVDADRDQDDGPAGGRDAQRGDHRDDGGGDVRRDADVEHGVDEQADGDAGEGGVGQGVADEREPPVDEERSDERAYGVTG